MTSARLKVRISCSNLMGFGDVEKTLTCAGVRTLRKEWQKHLPAPKAASYWNLDWCWPHQLPNWKIHLYYGWEVWPASRNTHSAQYMGPRLWGLRSKVRELASKKSKLYFFWWGGQQTKGVQQHCEKKANAGKSWPGVSKQLAKMINQLMFSNGLAWCPHLFTMLAYN